MFILPCEHLPHTATWMAFGADPAIWSASLAEKVCRDQAALALAIAALSRSICWLPVKTKSWHSN
ncbi:hypothetical protein [Morganella morganii]|uniref:hypothetical protein n=1 Tax=Morganella morganii TaxID=582 RepID=UPI003EB6BD39